MTLFTRTKKLAITAALPNACLLYYFKFSLDIRIFNFTDNRHWARPQNVISHQPDNSAMTRKITQTIFFFLTLVLTSDVFSQTGTIFFSVTGDTVCYSSVFGFEIDSSNIGHTTYIKRRNKNGEPLTISSFTISCQASNTCLETFPKDTIKKYNLQLDGTDGVFGQKSDFVVSVKPTNLKVVDTSSFGPKFIYQTKVIVFISCKGQQLYSNQFDIMFKGNSPDDFPKRDIVRIKAWQKKDTNKYFVDISIKEFQIFKKPTDTEYSHFKTYKFIL
jgi:hypothetical protein